jgi:hypothetical protein
MRSQTEVKAKAFCSSLVERLFTWEPEKIGIDLLGGDQMLQLLQSGKTTKGEHLSCHFDM